MSVQVRPMTAADLLRMPHGAWRYELVKGELHRMSPAGHTHGRIAARFLLFLAQFVQARGLGEVYAAETGFILTTQPDTVRAPDVAFVSNERLAAIQPGAEGFFPGAPDLAVEVVSPSDTYSEVEAKVIEWLQAGCRLVIVVDPRESNASLYRSLSNIAILSGDQVISADDILSGWSLRVADLFK